MIIEKIVDGFKIFIRENVPGIHAEFINWNGISDPREPEFLYLLRKELPTEGNIIDLGANIGHNTLVSARIIRNSGNRAKIYSIEPDFRNFELLKKAIEINELEDIVHVNQIMISDSVGEKTFYLSNSSNLNSINKTEHSSSEIKIFSTTLTDFMKDKGFPNFIKMDVESAEIEIFHGARDLFSKNFPCKILMETHQKLYTEERNLESELRFLLSQNFTIKYVISAGVAVPDVFKREGYLPDKIFESGIFERGIYSNIREHHAIEWASKKIYQKTKFGQISPKVVRSILLERT